MNILVAGAGAIGQLLGTRLHESGHQVTLWTTPRHVTALQQGLTIHGHTESHWQPNATTTLPHQHFDTIFLTSKAHQTAPLAAQIATQYPKGFIVSLQNGLGNLQKILLHTPASQAAAATTSHGVDMTKPGTLHHAGTGPTLIGPANPQHPEAARQAQTLLHDAGLEPTWQNDIRPTLWRKALANHAINPVAALHNRRNGEVADQPELWHLTQTLLREATALALRARIPPDTITGLEATVRETLERTATNRCSMLQDVQNRRPTEVEQITGRLVRLGERLLVSMPRSEAVYGRIKDLEATYMGPEAATRMAWNELPYEADAY